MKTFHNILNAPNIHRSCNTIDNIQTQFSFGILETIDDKLIGKSITTNCTCRESLNMSYGLIKVSQALGTVNNLIFAEECYSGNYKSSDITELEKLMEDEYLIFHLPVAGLGNLIKNEHLFHDISKNYNLGESEFIYPSEEFLSDANNITASVFIKLSKEWMSSTLMFHFCTLIIRDIARAYFKGKDTVSSFFYGKWTDLWTHNRYTTSKAIKKQLKLDIFFSNWKEIISNNPLSCVNDEELLGRCKSIDITEKSNFELSFLEEDINIYKTLYVVDSINLKTNIMISRVKSLFYHIGVNSFSYLASILPSVDKPSKHSSDCIRLPSLFNPAAKYKHFEHEIKKEYRKRAVSKKSTMLELSV